MTDALDAEWNRWNPPPLVLGDRVFSWTAWDVTLREAAEVPGAAQLTFLRHDQDSEMTFRDLAMAGMVGNYLRVGVRYVIIGLGQKLERENWYQQEFIFTRGLDDARLRWEFLTQGYLGKALKGGAELFFTQAEKERRRLLMTYFREVYCWGCLRGILFQSPQEKESAWPVLRREANDVAVNQCKRIFRFNGTKYRDDTGRT